MFISIGGLLAAATTINGIFMATPRDLLLYGKDKILPVAIGDINKRFGTPHWAIALTLVVGLAGVSLGMQIEEYALFTVMCFMLFDILVVIGLIRLTRRMPYLLDKARWKLGRRMQWFAYSGMLLFALLFMVVGLTTMTVFQLVLFVGLFAVGCLYYYLRWLYMKKNGINIVAEARDLRPITVAELDAD